MYIQVYDVVIFNFALKALQMLYIFWPLYEETGTGSGTIYITDNKSQTELSEQCMFVLIEIRMYCKEFRPN